MTGDSNLDDDFDDFDDFDDNLDPVAPVRKLSEGMKTLIATLVAVVVIAAGIALYVTHEHVYLHCVTPGKNSLLTAPTIPVSGGPVTTLPPSRDNDSGRSRPPDSTPDADNDVVRRTLICH